MSATGADSAVHKEIRKSSRLPLPMLWMVVAAVSSSSYSPVTHVFGNNTNRLL